MTVFEITDTVAAVLTLIHRRHLDAPTRSASDWTVAGHLQQSPAGAPYTTPFPPLAPHVTEAVVIAIQMGYAVLRGGSRKPELTDTGRTYLRQNHPRALAKAPS